MSTWDKKVMVNGRLVKKQIVREYYKNQWKKKSFRNLIKKKGVFVRSYFNGKSIIQRKNIHINNWNDMEDAIKNHAVEFITPVQNINAGGIIDIDLPKRLAPKKKTLTRSVIRKLKSMGIKIKEVNDSPQGAHVFTASSKKETKKALQLIANEDKKHRFHIGKQSKSKIVLDADEPNIAVPGSLSIKGSKYKKWKKY